EIVVGHHADHGAKDLVANDLHLRLHVDQHRRRIGRAFPGATDEDARPAAYGLVDPGFDALRRRFVEERADVSPGVAWIARLHALRRFDELVDEALVDFAMRIDRLNGNAALTGQPHSVPSA